MDLFDAIGLICFTVPAAFAAVQLLAAAFLVRHARGIVGRAAREAVAVALRSPRLYVALGFQAIWVVLAFSFRFRTERLPLAEAHLDLGDPATLAAIAVGGGVFAGYVLLSSCKVARFVVALRGRAKLLRVADAVLVPRGGPVWTGLMRATAWAIGAERRLADGVATMTRRALDGFILSSLAKVVLVGAGLYYYRVVLPAQADAHVAGGDALVTGAPLAIPGALAGLPFAAAIPVVLALGVTFLVVALAASRSGPRGRGAIADASCALVVASTAGLVLLEALLGSEGFVGGVVPDGVRLRTAELLFAAALPLIASLRGDRDETTDAAIVGLAAAGVAGRALGLLRAIAGDLPVGIDGAGAAALLPVRVGWLYETAAAAAVLAAILGVRSTRLADGRLLPAWLGLTALLRLLPLTGAFGASVESGPWSSLLLWSAVLVASLVGLTVRRRATSTTGPAAPSPRPRPSDGPAAAAVPIERRLLAAGVDLGLAVVAAAAFAAGADGRASPSALLAVMIVGFCGLAAAPRTPGQRIARLRLAAGPGAGAAANATVPIARRVLRAVVLLASPLTGLGPARPLVAADGRSLGDLAAGTRLVDAPGEPTPASGEVEAPDRSPPIATDSA